VTAEVASSVEPLISLAMTYVTVAVGEARRISPGRNWAAEHGAPIQEKTRQAEQEFRIPAPTAS